MTQGPQNGNRDARGQDAAARAADPNTSHAELYELAGSRPELRPQIAQNPNSYPELLDWLGTLGDPAVDAALASRHAGSAGQATRPITSAGAAAQDQPTEAFGAVQRPRYEEPDPQAGSDFDTRVYGEPVAAAPYPQNDYQYSASDYSYPPGDQHYAPAAGYPPQEEDEPRRRGGAGILVFLLALLTVAVLAAGFFLLFGSPFGNGDDDQQVEEQEQPAPAEPEQEDAEQEETEAPEPTEAESPTPEESPSPTEEDDPEEDEEDEDQLERPLPENALNITSFSAPSDNIHCQLTEQDVTCTIDEYQFDTPTGCENAVTLRVTAEGAAETACNDAVGSQGQNLGYGQFTGNDDFACEATETHFECWSQRTGNGFQLSRESYDLYDY